MRHIHSQTVVDVWTLMIALTAMRAVLEHGIKDTRLHPWVSEQELKRTILRVKHNLMIEED